MGRRPLGRWSSFALSIISFFTSSFVSAVAIPWLLRLAYGWRHPNDASAGDVAGWALVFGAPIFLPLILLISVIASIWVYRTARSPTPSVE